MFILCCNCLFTVRGGRGAGLKGNGLHCRNVQPTVWGILQPLEGQELPQKRKHSEIGFHCKKYLEKKVFHFADMSNAGCSSTKMSNTEYHITEIPDGRQMFETENILHNFPPLSCLKPNALQFLWNKNFYSVFPFL